MELRAIRQTLDASFAALPGPGAHCTSLSAEVQRTGVRRETAPWPAGTSVFELKPSSNRNGDVTGGKSLTFIPKVGTLPENQILDALTIWNCEPQYAAPVEVGQAFSHEPRDEIEDLGIHIVGIW